MMSVSPSESPGDASLLRPLYGLPIETIPALPNDELLIRQTFRTSAYQGCDLLFRRYYQPLCSHAARFVYNKAVAEDIVADIFQNFWQKCLYQHIEYSYRAYLYRAVRQNCLRYLQREAGRTISADQVDLHDLLTTLPTEQIQFDELMSQIETILNTLSPAVRRVFLLSRFEGRKNQEIADELLISLKTVEAHITKALALFRKVLLP